MRDCLTDVDYRDGDYPSLPALTRVSLALLFEPGLPIHRPPPLTAIRWPLALVGEDQFSTVVRTVVAPDQTYEKCLILLALPRGLEPLFSP